MRKVSALAEWCIDLSVARQLKTRRRNADYLVCLAIEDEVLADCGAIRGESALPQTLVRSGSRRVT
jgi:hypothetical protein